MNATDTQRWQAIAALTPHLRANIELHIQTHRGDRYCLLADMVNGNTFQLDARYFPVLSAFNGAKPLAEIEQSQQAAITRNELLTLISSLHDNNLLQGDLSRSREHYLQQAQNKKSPFSAAITQNPLFVRLPLVSIEPLASQLQPYCRWLYSHSAKVIFGICLLIGLLQVLFSLPRLTQYAAIHIGEFHSAVAMALCYFVLKSVHELAHAVTCKQWGGRCGKLGLAFILFYPLPYVDVSSSTLMADKRQRMAVAAAGIVAELVFAFIGLQLWLFSDIAAIKELGFYLVLIGGLSTVLFNANPLLRFDGYYVLADYLEIPNLYQRAQQRVKSALKSVIAGRDTPAGDATPLPRYLLGYGLAANSYRLLLSVSIAGYLANQWFFIGVALGLWVLIAQLVLPMMRFCRELLPDIQRRGQQQRATTISIVALIAVLASIIIEIPHNTVLSGIAQSPEMTRLKNHVEGYVTAMDVADGERVEQQQSLLHLRNRVLDNRIAQAQAKLDAVDIEIRQASDNALAQLNAALQTRDNLRRDLQALEAEHNALTLRSPASGRVRLLDPLRLQGVFLKKGALIGHIETDKPVEISLALDQRTYVNIEQCLKRIEVRRKHAPQPILTASIKQLAEAATTSLPNKRLSDALGGDITTDKRDLDNTASLVPVFPMELLVDASHTQHWSSQSVSVKFIFCNTSLAKQALNALNRYHLNTFNR